jgi:outer membrane biosynthesis protein TonB
MKRASIFVIAMVLTVSLIGCSQQPDTEAGSRQPEQASSFSAGEIYGTALRGAMSTEAASTENIVTGVVAIPLATPEQTIAASRQTGDPALKAPKTAKSKKEKKKSSKAKPKAKKKKAKKPKKQSKPKSAYDAPYGKATIGADAKAYGESIGMTWSGSLTKDNCSWEAPIQTSRTLSGKRLKKAIQSGIRRVKKLQSDNEYRPGEFHFKLLLEPVSGGEYSLYFLMG